MDKTLVLKALKKLDEKIGEENLPLVKMISGGGASMVLAYGFPGKTQDMDAIPTNIEFETIKALAEEVAREMQIDHDWLNPYFGAFTIYLPSDVQARTVVVYQGRNLFVQSLGPEDILIMKLMAGRSKDVAHTKFLLNTVGVNLDVVEKRLYEMKKSGLYVKQVDKALDLLDEFLEEKN